MLRCGTAAIFRVHVRQNALAFWLDEVSADANLKLSHDKSGRNLVPNRDFVEIELENGSITSVLGSFFCSGKTYQI